MRVWISCLLILLLADVTAQTPEEKGLAIAKEMEQRDTGWKDVSTRLTMILRNRQGQESRRQVRVQTLEVEGGGGIKASPSSTRHAMSKGALFSVIPMPWYLMTSGSTYPH